MQCPDPSQASACVQEFPSSHQAPVVVSHESMVQALPSRQDVGQVSAGLGSVLEAAKLMPAQPRSAATALTSNIDRTMALRMASSPRSESCGTPIATPYTVKGAEWQPHTCQRDRSASATRCRVISLRHRTPKSVLSTGLA